MSGLSRAMSVVGSGSRKASSSSDKLLHSDLMRMTRRLSPSRLPQCLLRAMESSRRTSAGPTNDEIVVPDAVLIQRVHLVTGGRSGDPGPAEEELGTCDPRVKPFLMSDPRWRENRLAIPGGSAWRKVGAFFAGPGGAYQASYRVYSLCAAWSLALAICSLALLIVLATFALMATVGSPQPQPPVTGVAADRASQAAQLFILSCAACGCGTAAVVAIFCALLARAGAVFQFACRRDCSTRDSGDICDLPASVAADETLDGSGRRSTSKEKLSKY